MLVIRELRLVRTRTRTYMLFRDKTRQPMFRFLIIINAHAKNMSTKHDVAIDNSHYTYVTQNHA